jgi:hypothetical protein
MHASDNRNSPPHRPEFVGHPPWLPVGAGDCAGLPDRRAVDREVDARRAPTLHANPHEHGTST